MLIATWRIGGSSARWCSGSPEGLVSYPLGLRFQGHPGIKGMPPQGSPQLSGGPFPGSPYTSGRAARTHSAGMPHRNRRGSCPVLRY